MNGARASAVAACAVIAAGCGPAAVRLEGAAREPSSPFAVEVVSFDPGVGAGFGADALPDIVLGRPDGGFTSKGSEDVVSLGHGGSIVLRIGEPITDGEGPDLVVFENPFLYPGGVFAEPGQVSVSEDGEAWSTFPCDPAAPTPNGCAGFEPVRADKAGIVDATRAPDCGGDLFDLAWLDDAPAEVRYVRVDDRGEDRIAPTAGFDLDAIARLSH